MQALAHISRSAAPLSRVTGASRRTSRAVFLLPSRSSRTAAVHTMAFVSSKQEQLSGQARKFVETWGSVASRGLDAVRKDLDSMVADDCVFKADGVLYTDDLKGKSAIMHALEREHGVYEHTKYYPVAVAANDDDNIAFVGVAWEYKNIGPLRTGAQPTGMTSRGFSIKQLTFDKDGKLKCSRVNRQMTAEEQQELVKPGVRCQPADVFGDVLPKLGWGAQDAAEQKEHVADADFAERMKANLMTWVHCWNSKADLGTLDRVLAPSMLAYDAYGLHHAADKPDREGHAISMMGREDARASIAELHRKFTDRNKLVSFAVNEDQRVAFDHWHGEAKGRDSDVTFTVEGVDMILFNPQGQISTLVQFDMQNYSKQLQGRQLGSAGAPAGSGAQ